MKKFAVVVYRLHCKSAPKTPRDNARDDVIGVLEYAQLMMACNLGLEFVVSGPRFVMKDGSYRQFEVDDRHIRTSSDMEYF